MKFMEKGGGEDSRGILQNKWENSRTMITKKKQKNIKGKEPIIHKKSKKWRVEKSRKKKYLYLYY